MRATARLLATGALALTLVAGGCGSHAKPDAGFFPAETDDSPESRLTDLTAVDGRVAAVAWRLARANADLCPVSRQRAGWTLQSATQYGAELRPVAERRFGLAGDLPGVLAAPDDSPAALAGLAPGDLIIAVNGHPLSLGAAGQAGSYEGLQANITVLDGAIARGAARLTVRRGGVERSVDLRPVLACAYATQVNLQISPRSGFDGRLVWITQGMVKLAQSEDELAFALAHELSHAVLEHRTQPDVTGVKGASNWAISMRRGLSLSAEADADRMAAYLVARAAYDPDRSVEFLNRLGDSDPLMRTPQVNLGGVYEGTSARRRALQPVLEDIAARKAAGRALIP